MHIGIKVVRINERVIAETNLQQEIAFLNVRNEYVKFTTAGHSSSIQVILNF